MLQPFIIWLHIPISLSVVISPSVSVSYPSLSTSTDSILSLISYYSLSFL